MKAANPFSVFKSTLLDVETPLASARANFVSFLLNRPREGRGHVSCVIAMLKELGVVCRKGNESRSK